MVHPAWWMGEVVMRGRARLAMAAAAVLVVVASAAYPGLTLTSRVEPGSEWYGLDGSSGSAIRPLAPGDRVQMAVSVRNPGAVPIILDAVLVEAPDLAVDDITVIAHAMGNPNCCRPEMAEPFHPVDIGTHDEALVWLVLRLTGAGTYVPCSYFTLVSVEVRYRVLGMHRTQPLELPNGLSFGPACDRSP